jgi:dipeptidyl aminopeptidase/acylaminoacyl peptidase
MRAISAMAALAVLSTVAVAASASATTPGTNGRVAYVVPVARMHHTTFAVAAVNADGTGARRLTHPRDGVLDERPDWSPDGSKVAFERCAARCAIYTVNADGTGLRRVGPNCRRMPPACEDRGAPAWSPDGKTIAFTRSWGPVKHKRIAHAELFAMRPNGGGVRRITRLTATKPYGVDPGRATWSPDATRLAFGVDKRATGRGLFVVNADGSGLKRLTAWKLRAGEHPDFSPDGERILFGAGSRGEQDRGGNLYAIRPDGSELVKLTHSGRRGIVSAGSFAPAGGQLTFAMLPPDDDFATSLFVSDTDGTSSRKVANTAFARQPDWGPLPAPSRGERAAP